MWIECYSEKQRKIAKYGLIKNCDSGVCKIALSVGKGCRKKYKEQESEKMFRLRPFRKNDAKTIITWTNKKEEFYKWSAGILGEYPVTG